MYTNVNATELDDFIFGLESYMIADFEIGMEGKIGDAFTNAKNGIAGVGHTIRTKWSEFYHYIIGKLGDVVHSFLEFIKHPVKSTKDAFQTAKQNAAARREDRANRRTAKALNKMSKKEVLTKKDIEKLKNLTNINFEDLSDMLTRDDVEINEYDRILKIIDAADILSSESTQDTDAISQETLHDIVGLLQKVDKFVFKAKKKTPTDDGENTEKKRSILTRITSILSKAFTKAKNTESEKDVGDTVGEGEASMGD